MSISCLGDRIWVFSVAHLCLSNAHVHVGYCDGMYRDIIFRIPWFSHLLFSRTGFYFILWLLAFHHGFFGFLQGCRDLLKCFSFAIGLCSCVVVVFLALFMAVIRWEIEVSGYCYYFMVSFCILPVFCVGCCNLWAFAGWYLLFFKV